MLIAQIYYLTLNARELTRPMCFDLSRDARASVVCRSRVARVLCVFHFIGMKCVFRHQDLQMFGPKLSRDV